MVLGDWMKLGFVSVALIIENKKVLMVIDEDIEYKFPGGRVEENETLEMGLRRELREEIDSDVKIFDFINAYSRFYKDVKYTMFNYRVKLLTKPKAKNEVKSISWYSYKECQKLPLSPNAKQLIELSHKKGEL